MRPLLIAALIASLVALLLAPARLTAASRRQYATLDEKSVADAIGSSPDNYIAAVVEVVSHCEFRHDETCFDRVRITELIAQPSSPPRQYIVGDDLLLLSGKGGDPKKSSNPVRYVLLAVPMQIPNVPLAYGAKWLSVTGEQEGVCSLRNAIDAVLKE